LCSSKERKYWAWWFMPVIPARGRLRQEDHKFAVSLSNIVILYLKIKTKKQEGRN
jgi:hypothetical protein